MRPSMLVAGLWVIWVVCGLFVSTALLVAGRRIGIGLGAAALVFASTLGIGSIFRSGLRVGESAIEGIFRPYMRRD